MENNNLKLDDGTVLDPKVLKVVRALRSVESGGSKDPYNQYGDNGASLGAFQWNNNKIPLKKGELPINWKNDAQQFLNDANAPMTPGNQNKTMYFKVKARKDEGRMPDEIAALHNGAKKGADGRYEYINPEYGQKFRNALGSPTSSGFIQPGQSAPEQPQAPQQMTYDVPTDHSALQKNAQAEMEAAQLEAKKQSNPLRILGNTLLNIPKTLFNSASNLGETIGQSLATPEVEQNLSDANASIGGSQQRLINKIRRVEAEGGDATRLKQRYNQSITEQKNNIPSLEEVVPGAFKSNAQIAGEVAGTGLDLLTAGVGGILGKGLTGKLATKAGSAVARSGIGAVAPELSAIADQTASGLLTKQGIKNVTKGAGIGYASDVTQGLQGERGEDREGANAFIPGFGTALGGGIPAISESVQSAKNALNPIKAVDDLEESIIETYTGTKSRKKKLTNAERATEAKNRYTTGRTPTRVMAEDAIVPKIQGTKFNTAKQAEDYRESFSKLHETNREVLSELDGQGARVRLNDLESDALREARSTINVDSGKSEGLVKATKREFANLRKVYGEEIPLSKLDEIKSARWKEASKRGLFDTQQQLNKDINYNIAKAAQRKIESVARRMGAEDVAQLNREIGDKLEAARFLEMLDGETVKGGRLGGYFARGIGAMAGGSVGGPIGTILGAFGGDVVANILMSNSVAGPVKRLILKRVQRQDPVAYTKTIAWLKKQGMDRDTRLALPERGGSVFSKREAVIAKNKEVAQKLGILKKDNLELPAGKPNEVGTVVNEGKPIRVAPQGAIETTGSEIVAGKTSPSQKPQSSPNMQNAATVDMVNEQGSYKQPLKDTVLNDTVPETEEVPTDIVTALNKSDIQKELQREKDMIDEQIDQLKIQKDSLDSQYTSKSQEAAARKIAQSQSKLKEKQFTDESVVGKENTKRKRMAEQYSGGEIDENADEMNKIAEGYNKKQSDKKTLIQKIRENSQKQRELKATARKGGVKLLSGGGLGAAAGVETDEDGNITGYDFNKGVKGALGGVLFAGSVGSAFGDEARDMVIEALKKAGARLERIPKKGQIDFDTIGRKDELIKHFEKGKNLTNEDFREAAEIARLGGVDVGILPLKEKISRAKVQTKGGEKNTKN